MRSCRPGEAIWTSSSVIERVFGRRAIAVLTFRNVFGDENCVLADSAEAAGEFFGSVVVHVNFHLNLVSKKSSNHASAAQDGGSHVRPRGHISKSDRIRNGGFALVSDATEGYPATIAAVTRASDCAHSWRT